MTPIIRFENVSKRYSLRRDRPRSFREAFVRRQVGERRRETDAVWALRDVSFDITPGETVALIGPNGAGKSSALKLISRVIGPNAGRVIVNGQVAALLELGTGFHPDLTGRENVFLAGALAGMGRKEVSRKFSGIVEFAELEDFIDVQVKHYSSGMFARLAFSVSIYLDPEILLVDEVLAVGDQAFQHKCLDRIGAMKRSGVTIFFVSHSMETVRSLCSRALWIERGLLKADGPAADIVQQYLGWVSGWVSDGSVEANPDLRFGSRKVEIVRVRLLDEHGDERKTFRTGEPVHIAMDYRVNQPVSSAVFGLAIHRIDGVHVCGPNTLSSGLNLPDHSEQGTVTYTIPYLPLLDGFYQLSLAITNRADTEFYDYYDRAFSFRVENSLGGFPERYGLITLCGAWHHTSA